MINESRGTILIQKDFSNNLLSDRREPSGGHFGSGGSDTKIDKWKEAGLLYPSLVTGIIRTIKDGMIIHRLGTLSEQDFQKAQDTLKKVMGF